jgi:hypothetical protein
MRRGRIYTRIKRETSASIPQPTRARLARLGDRATYTFNSQILLNPQPLSARGVLYSYVGRRVGTEAWAKLRAGASDRGGGLGEVPADEFPRVFFKTWGRPEAVPDFSPPEGRRGLPHLVGPSYCARGIL